MSLFRITFVLLVVSLFVAEFIYYPKWKQSGTEATLSWDASGYYMYLPAIFIYKDLKQCNFKEEILKNYNPTPDFQQAYLHPSGNYVMKYSSGQAIQFLPAFFLSHLYTTYLTDYPPDGFSRPYQLGISIHAFIIAVLGLFFIGKVLLHYFSERIVSLTMVCIVLGSNYLDYSAINGAMTHNGLFTIYAALIWITINYYKSPTIIKAIGIGSLIGLAALTRPTEIISIIIPLLWGVEIFNKQSFIDRFSFIKTHLNHLITVGVLIVFIASIQLFYWKYVTGEWLVYSYEEQGFSWLKPHIWDGLLSYKSGWITYSPLFILIFPGFIFLWKMHRSITSSLGIFIIMFVYITFAWDIWWYGGSLGQRAMVQSYPVLAFPLAAFFATVIKNKWQFKILITFVGACIIYNLWLTHQAHKGGLFHAGQMTKAYFWKTFGKFEKNEEYLKLLDTNEEYLTSKKGEVIYFNDLEKDTSDYNCSIEPIFGNSSLCLSSQVQFSPEFKVNINFDTDKWIRSSATFKCINKEWEVWKMTQFITKCYKSGKEIKSKLIRVHRLLHDGEIQEIEYQTKIPKETDTIGVYFWNAGSNKEIQIDDIKLTILD